MDKNEQQKNYSMSQLYFGIHFTWVSELNDRLAASELGQSAKSRQKLNLKNLEIDRSRQGFQKIMELQSPKKEIT